MKIGTVFIVAIAIATVITIPGRSGDRGSSLVRTRRGHTPRSAHWSARWILLWARILAECRAEWGRKGAVKPAEDSLPGRL